MDENMARNKILTYFKRIWSIVDWKLFKRLIVQVGGVSGTYQPHVLRNVFTKNERLIY